MPTDRSSTNKKFLIVDIEKQQSLKSSKIRNISNADLHVFQVMKKIKNKFTSDSNGFSSFIVKDGAGVPAIHQNLIFTLATGS